MKNDVRVLEYFKKMVGKDPDVSVEKKAEIELKAEKMITIAKMKEKNPGKFNRLMQYAKGMTMTATLEQ